MNNFVFCNQCGTQLPRGSKFCNNCGATVTAPRPAAPALGQRGASFGSPPPAMLDEAEHVIFTLRPTMIFVYCWYAAALLVLIAVAAVMGLSGLDTRTALYVILGAGLIAFAVPLYKHILRRREVYTLTNFKLEMRYGLIAKDVRNIPLNKIQDVTVSRTVFQRLLGLGDILIDSASESGQIHLDDIHKAEGYADQILTTLRRWN